MFETIGLIILAIVGWITTTVLLFHYVIDPIVNITYINRHGSSLKNTFITAFGIIIFAMVLFGNISLWVFIIGKILGEI